MGKTSLGLAEAEHYSELSLESAFASCRLDSCPEAHGSCAAARSSKSEVFLLCAPEQNSPFGSFIAHFAASVLAKSVLTNDGCCTCESIESALKKVDNKLATHPELSQHGSVSIACAAIQGNQLLWAQRGLCQVLLVTQGSLMQLGKFPRRPSSLNIKADLSTNDENQLVSTFEHPVWPGDKIILVSPHFMKYVPATEIAALVSRQTADEAASALVKRGANRNCPECYTSVIILHELSDDNLDSKLSPGGLELSLSKDEDSLAADAKALGLKFGLDNEKSKKKKTSFILKKCSFLFAPLLK